MDSVHVLFLLKNKSETRKSPPFCRKAPILVQNQAVVHEFSRRPLVFEIFPKKYP
jgi:hypothetical protein